jgi:hypothetical protein
MTTINEREIKRRIDIWRDRQAYPTVSNEALASEMMDTLLTEVHSLRHQLLNVYTHIVQQREY